MIKMMYRVNLGMVLPKKPMAKMVLGAALVASAMGVACSGSAAGGAAPPQGGGMPVKVEVAKSVAVSDTTDYVATLKSRDSAVIMADAKGRLFF